MTPSDQKQALSLFSTRHLSPTSLSRQSADSHFPLSRLGDAVGRSDHVAVADEGSSAAELYLDVAVLGRRRLVVVAVVIVNVLLWGKGRKS